MWFRCSGGNGTGDGATITVTYSSDFYGSTITATNGSKTVTKVAPSTGSAEIKVSEEGIWTISAPAQGQTFSTTTTVVLDYTAQLTAIPDGSTATPTDIIQTWLHCGNIWDKNYTTISQVLSDTTTLLALISSNNAADYMARSTSWATDVCSDSTAMTYIGNNDYCAEALLSNSTWASAICNSTYRESVLNVKVPTMTSDTTPSGVVSGTTPRDSSTYARWKAFDGNIGTQYQGNVTTAAGASNSGYLQYEFVSPVSISCIYVKGLATLPYKALKVEVSSDGNTYETIYDETGLTLSEGYIDVPFTKNKKYVKVTVTQKNEADANQYLPRFYELQIYGRTL